MDAISMLKLAQLLHPGPEDDLVSSILNMTKEQRQKETDRNTTAEHAVLALGSYMMGIVTNPSVKIGVELLKRHLDRDEKFHDEVIEAACRQLMTASAFIGPTMTTKLLAKAFKDLRANLNPEVLKDPELTGPLDQFIELNEKYHDAHCSCTKDGPDDDDDDDDDGEDEEVDDSFPF
jgi:hypothetical protein